MYMDILRHMKVLPGAIPSLITTVIVLFLLPILWMVAWKHHCKEKVSLAPLFFGAAGFLVFARILEQGLHMVCVLGNNPISRFINGNTVAYVIYGSLMAGIFEECGRYIIIKFIMKKNKTKENMVMYGIGHGGIEVWAITLISVLNLLIIALMIKSQGMEAALKALGIPQEMPDLFAFPMLSTVTSMIASAAGYNVVTGALCIFERIVCMFIHVSLTILVAYGINKNEKKYLFLAVLAHAIVDTLPALSQRSSGSVWVLITELWICICAVGLIIWARRLYRQWPEQSNTNVLPHEEFDMHRT